MPRQTDEQMKDHGATAEEITAARELFRVLRPALRVTRATGRIDTTHGDKTVLGLYRTVKALTGAFKPSTLIIEALNAAAPEPSWSANKHAQHRVTCSRFADTFERANKDFNRVDFYASCGVETPVEPVYRVQHNIGKSKYVVSFHDGRKKHKDGSPFFDVEIFKNKKS